MHPELSLSECWPQLKAVLQGRYSVPGQLQNFNTEKGFKDLDKAAALKQVDTVSQLGVLSINMQHCCLLLQEGSP